MEGEGQSHHLLAFPEFLHYTHWLSLNHMALLSCKEAWEMSLRWVPCCPRQRFVTKEEGEWLYWLAN